MLHCFQISAKLTRCHSQQRLRLPEARRHPSLFPDISESLPGSESEAAVHPRSPAPDLQIPAPPPTSSRPPFQPPHTYGCPPEAHRRPVRLPRRRRGYIGFSIPAFGDFLLIAPQAQRSLLLHYPHPLPHRLTVLLDVRSFPANHPLLLKNCSASPAPPSASLAGSAHQNTKQPPKIPRRLPLFASIVSDLLFDLSVSSSAPLFFRGAFCP